MPKRRHPEPQSLAAIVTELLARAERGPLPPWTPDPAAPAQRYRSPRYARHPGQLPLRFPEKVPDGADTAPAGDVAMPSRRRPRRAP